MGKNHGKKLSGPESLRIFVGFGEPLRLKFLFSFVWEATPLASGGKITVDVVDLWDDY